MEGNYENVENAAMTSARSRRTQSLFTVGVLAAELLGVAAVIITGVWGKKYHDGYTWRSDVKKEFNFHPLFMVMGMILLYGNAILVYRIFVNERKNSVKILHAALHVLALACAAFGLVTVFDSHNLAEPKSIPNMYSLHSWLGLSAVVLFGLQWLFGLVAFLVPGVSDALKGLYKPLHVFWGLVIFVCAIAAALMGITEKLIFSNDPSDNYFYADLHAEHVLMNVTGLLLVAFGIVVVFLVTNDSFRRQTPPEQQPLILSREEEKTSSADQ